MSLVLVATPIGNPKDISLRALENLESCDLVIGEEKRVLMPFLKSHGLEKKSVDFLNEHSKSKDLEDLVLLCRDKHVCLVSDCGTPGFCDPGADLVAACRKQNISVHSVPGASSLMTLLSLSGVKLETFVFIGFLPAESTLRKQALDQIKKEKRPMVLMDTPYRMTKLLDELSQTLPQRRCVLGCDLTKESEIVHFGSCNQIKTKVGETKAEFVLLIL